MKNYNVTMMTDFYEFTMGYSYYKEGRQDEIAVFDAFYRKNPFNTGYGVMGGVDEIVDLIKNFHFTDEDIEYLKSTDQFPEDYLKYLRNLKFTGSV